MRWFIFLFIGLLVVTDVLAATQDAAFVAGLRERGLYPLAEEYGRKHFGREDLPERERAELAIQLALVYTEQAIAAPPESRDALWAKADGACAALIDGWPNNPRRRIVEVQRALVSLARGEQARKSRNLAAALDHLRAATRDLSSVADAVGRELVDRRLRPRGKLPPDDLSVEELESLEANISFQLARAERQTGLCHPPGTADHDDALLQSVKRLTPLARQTPPDDLVWSARVELAACQRELGHGEVAAKLVATWMQEKPPSEVAVRLLAETSPTEPLPDKNHADATQHPAGSVDTAMQMAAKEREAGRFAAAAERYRRFAIGQPDDPRAAEAHRLAILCTADLLRNTAPADRPQFAGSYEALLQEHLARWPTQATADDARLWYGRLLAGRQDWSPAVAVLEQVRPASKGFAESVRLVAECYENQLRQLAARGEAGALERARLLAAATHFLQPVITGPDNRWPRAWSDLQRNIAVALAQLHVRYSDQPSSYAEQLLTAALRGTPAAADAKSLSQNRPRRGGQAHFAPKTPQNEPVPDGSGIGSKADELWKSTARSLLIGALARNGKTGEALAVVNQLTNAPSESLLEALASVDGLITQPTTVSDDGPQELGQLALAIVRLLDERHTELSDSDLGRLDRYRATALAAAGDRQAALAHYAALVAQLPDDGDIQERYAELLAASDSVAELRQALARWQQVESRSRRGGERWRRTRTARIELLTRLGDQAEAEKLIRLTRLLYPDWKPTTAP